jgi:hypothetical protein
MAKPPEDPRGDPRIADLARYRKQREAEKRRKPPKPPRPPGSGLLGSNPRAGLILALLAVGVILFLVLPRVLPLLK